ncbi:hypothetical protein [Streptomyces sp. NBC_01373]|uniref:hypothetical protein n=1 Tax=Streptomyces sp. NBC_01373 TaxID=2903843 RepID=UPI002250D5C9|nr:hypothetical protein [Streptomyces sp. NBC_01373]MCX4697013.1 hypothetical protein [Streptomyces sp. NBC_01373]MCX4707062.1 hypothetical protein [Streptomyces sp. NBC_01373]
MPKPMTADELKIATTELARQAAEKAMTGPKTHEDALHGVIDRNLTELQARRGR